MAQLFKDRFPELIKYFNPNINKDIDFDTLSSFSRKIVNWTCQNGHVFSKQTGDFSRSPSCKQCRHSEVLKLADIPWLLKEFDFKKNTLKPEEISANNNRIKVWWSCQYCKNSWEARTHGRFKKKTGCPKCAGNSVSKIEKRLFIELNTLFENVESQFLVEDRVFDIYIKDINLLIEYDGVHWHKKTVEKDKYKNKIAKEHNFNLLRLREEGLKNIIEHEIKIPKKFANIRGDKTEKSILNMTLSYILKNFIEKDNKKLIKKIENYIKIDDFNDNYSYLKNLIKKPPKNNVTTHEKLNKEWHVEKNLPLKPEHLPLTSFKKVWWQCDVHEEHVWQAPIRNRIIRGCPFCANRPGYLSVTNRLDIKYPNIAKQWDYKKNKDTPEDYTYRSGQEKHWICSSCNHEFKKKIFSRTETNGFCPNCKEKTI